MTTTTVTPTFSETDWLAISDYRNWVFGRGLEGYAKVLSDERGTDLAETLATLERGKALWDAGYRAGFRLITGTEETWVWADRLPEAAPRQIAWVGTPQAVSTQRGTRHTVRHIHRVEAQTA